MTSLAELLSSGKFDGQKIPLRHRAIPVPTRSSFNSSELRHEALWPVVKASMHADAESQGSSSSEKIKRFSKQGEEDGACMFELRSATWLEGRQARGDSSEGMYSFSSFYSFIIGWATRNI